MNRYGFGISIATKSDFVLRDIDVLKEISLHSPVLINLTITTADDALCRKIEPNVTVSSDRFKAIKKFSDNGIYTGILMMPVLPFIEDTEENIERIVKLAHENGAKFIYPALGMTLRGNQRDWYYKKLDELFPSVKQKYIRYYRNSYECHSLKSKELWNLFRNECNRFSILYKMNDIIKAYKGRYEHRQLSLFD